jgi:hypothetical protein
MVLPSTTKTTQRAVVRKGPLCIGLIILLAPLAIISVLNTRLEEPTDTRADQLVELRHWRPSLLSEETEPKTKTESGGEWNSHSILQEDKAIHVLIVDTRDQWWFLASEYKEERPDTELRLIGGTALPAEAPWVAAQRFVQERLGVASKAQLRIPPPSPTSSTKDGSLAKGQVPSSASDQWVLLGRLQTQREGGHLYTYLYKPQQVDMISTKVSPLEKSKLQQAILNGRFYNVRAYASIALGMAYLDEGTPWIVYNVILTMDYDEIVVDHSIRSRKKNPWSSNDKI